MAGRQGEGLNPRHGEDRPMDSIRALSSWSMAERRRGEGKESGRDTHSGGMRSCRRAEKIGGGEEGGGLRLIPAYALKSSLASCAARARSACGEWNGPESLGKGKKVCVAGGRGIGPSVYSSVWFGLVGSDVEGEK